MDLCIQFRAITELRTDPCSHSRLNRDRHVRTTAEASQTGPATNSIQGLAQDFQSSAAPALVIAMAILAEMLELPEEARNGHSTRCNTTKAVTKGT